MSRYEYRVRWRREGGRVSTRITQKQPTAIRKVLAVLGVEAIRDEVDGLRAFPALVERPVIQRREVGPWEDFDHTPPVLTESKIADMRYWASYRYPDEHTSTITIFDDVGGEPF